jgi:hypothetical protein
MMVLVHFFSSVISTVELFYSDMTGPTSFAPIIETAIGIVDNSGGQYHVLMIIADGQVSHMICISSFI